MQKSKTGMKIINNMKTQMSKHQWKCENSKHCISHKHVCVLCGKKKKEGELNIYNMNEVQDCKK